ncbi:ABC transporter ATP-binding protein [Flindersiella endophytica]
MRLIVGAYALAAVAAPGSLVSYLILTLSTAGLPVISAWLLKLVIDVLSSGAGLGRLLGLAAGLAVTGLVATVTPQFTQYLGAQVNRAVGVLAQDRLFGAVEGFVGLGRFEDPQFVDRLRLAQRASDMPNQAVNGVLGIGRAIMTVSGFVVSLWLLSPALATLVLLSGIPMLVAQVALSRRRSRMFWDISPTERREVFYGQLLSTVTAAKEVRLLGIGAYLRGRMLTARRAANAARRAMDRRQLAAGGGLGLLAALISSIALLWSVRAAQAGALSVGDVTIFVAAVAAVQGTLAAMAGEVAQTHQALQMFGYYTAVTTAGPDLPVSSEPRALPASWRHIELDDVWFRYSDDHPWVLRGVNLRIPYGRTLALVGLNGAGKSTLVKLLCRLYDPTRGAIRWDGVDIREVDVTKLRQRIGAVFQDHMCYDMTAAENIGLGDLDAFDDRARIVAAAGRAGIHSTLVGLPRGYDTLLSRIFFMESDKNNPEKGVLLSGGQWQRVALARAFVREGRDLMILDEPSSGLDAEAEHEIHSSLRRHREGHTSLLISHRLNAVRDADSIAVISDGHIVEQGDHATLMATAGEYARLFTLQASGYKASSQEESHLQAQS